MPYLQHRIDHWTLEEVLPQHTYTQGVTTVPHGNRQETDQCKCLLLVRLEVFAIKKGCKSHSSVQSPGDEV